MCGRKLPLYYQLKYLIHNSLDRQKKGFLRENAPHLSLELLKIHLVSGSINTLTLQKKIAELAILNAQSRLKSSKKVVRKKIVSGPALPGKLSDCTSSDLDQTEVFPS
jgi:DNA gyrase/topoisomerase IV subunit B